LIISKYQYVYYVKIKIKVSSWISKTKTGHVQITRKIKDFEEINFISTVIENNDHYRTSST